MIENSKGELADWAQVGWVKKGEEAVTHLLRVACGLESKILGDFQIIGQIKKAFEQSKAAQLDNTLLDRLVNTCFRTSKRVKNETELCSGTASVAYAAVDFIREWDQAHSIQKILLFGAGDIGKATCSNLQKQFPQAELLITNRSAARAQVLENKLGVKTVPWEEKAHALSQADIIVVATGAPQAILTPDMIQTDKAQLFLDLSVPRNIAPEVGQMPQTTLLDMDQLISHTQEAIASRQSEVPAADQILAESKNDFLTWLEKRKFASAIHSLKAELTILHEEEIAMYKKKNPEADSLHLERISERMLHKITGRVARYIHLNHEKLGTEVNIFAEALSK